MTPIKNRAIRKRNIFFIGICFTSFLETSYTIILIHFLKKTNHSFLGVFNVSYTNFQTFSECFTKLTLDGAFSPGNYGLCLCLLNVKNCLVYLQTNNKTVADTIKTHKFEKIDFFIKNGFTQM